MSEEYAGALDQLKVYRIRNWKKLYENNRTRDLTKMTWVPVPNKHDGDGFTDLITRPNGVALFGAWNLIIQVASKCEPRGVLVRDVSSGYTNHAGGCGNHAGGCVSHRIPHSETSLARVTRCPEDIMRDALRACIEIGWIEVIPLSDIVLDSDTRNPALGCVELPMEWNGMEGNSSTPIVPLSGDIKKGPLQLRAEKLMRRRPETPLTDKEKRAFSKNAAAIKATSEDDWKLLEAFYAAPQSETFARKDLSTLVNNWNGEIDRARAWRNTPKRVCDLREELHALEESMGTHPANNDSVFHNPNCAQMQKDEFKAMKEKATALKAQIARGGK